MGHMASWCQELVYCCICRDPGLAWSGAAVHCHFLLFLRLPIRPLKNLCIPLTNLRSLRTLFNQRNFIKTCPTLPRNLPNHSCSLRGSNPLHLPKLLKCPLSDKFGGKFTPAKFLSDFRSAFRLSDACNVPVHLVQLGFLYRVSHGYPQFSF